MTLDGTLGREGSTEVDGSPGHFEINEVDGQYLDRNLFHSFDRFDLKHGEVATFRANSPTQNIIARITGGPSTIAGSVVSEIVGANLFLLNSGGLVVSDGATFEVGGVVRLTTADYLEFNQNPQQRFLSSKTSHDVFVGDITAFGFLRAPSGVALRDLHQHLSPMFRGEKLDVIAGDIIVERSALLIPEGAVRLVSVGGPDRVGLNASGFDFSGASPALGASIRVTDSTIDLSGRNAASTLLFGGSIEFLNAQLIIGAKQGGSVGGIEIRSGAGIDIADSVVFTEIVDSGQGPGIQLHAPAELRVTNSLIQAATVGAGRGGDVQVSAGTLGVHRQSFLGTVSVDGGTSPGSVFVSAGDITLSDRSFTGSFVVGSGSADVVVDIAAGRLRVLDGSAVGFDLPLFARPDPFGAFSSRILSSVSIRASESIEVSGVDTRRVGSQIVNRNINGIGELPGQRTLRIQTPLLRVVDGGFIATGTLGAGSAASIELDVGDLILRGGVIAALAGFSDRDAPTTSGEGGSVRIRASGNVSFSKQSIVDTGTRGSGSGGDIEIRASIIVVDESDLRTVTAPNVLTEARAGNSGDIRIEANELQVLNGGLVRADTGSLPGIEAGPDGSGDAGNVFVRAGRIVVQGVGKNDHMASRISTSTPTPGAGGNVFIETGSLLVSDGGEISAETLGRGRAGNVEIVAGELDLREGGRIRTDARQSDGGDISIGGQSALLRAGQITTAGNGGGGNIALGSDLTVLGDADVIANGRVGNGGNVSISSRFLVGDTRRVQVKSELGTPGMIGNVSPELSLIRDVADLPAIFLSAQKLLRPQCAAREFEATSSFVIAERSGVGASPQAWLLAFDDGGSVLSNVTTSSEDAEYFVAAEEARARAVEAFRSGDYAGARQGFLDASASSDLGTRSAALRGKAQVEQAAGDFRESVRSLLEALLAAEKSGSAAQIAAVLGSLGNAYVALEKPELAADHLARGLELARRAGAQALAAEILVNQGNHRAIQGQLEAALQSYTEAAELAAQAERPLHAVQALANASRVALSAGRYADAAALIERARAQAGALPPTQDRVHALTHLAQSELLLADEDPASQKARMLRAHELLMEAVKLGVRLGAHRASSYALGSLAELYERDHRYEEALQGTYRAIAAAEQAGASESLYRLHWQAGRILGALGRGDDSLDALRRAVSLVQKLRPESALSYTRSEVSFRDSVAPVYVSLLDALLARADGLADPQQAERLLLEARSTREEMRAAELRDYFRDECVADLAQRARPVEEVSADAAIVYPVVLPNRVELLVSTGGRLRRHVSRVGADELGAQASALRQALQRSLGQTAYLEPAQNLYRWLVEPYAQELEKAGVRTLVFVPDGPLGTIPMAALHDGKDFLIRRFAVAVTPGLSLTDPRPLERERLKVLVAGLSEPVQDFPELPHVVAEVDAIRSLYSDTTVLLNDGFTEQRTEKALGAQPFSILHIASHGSFSADAAQSFLLTHDGQISMRDLTELVGRTRFRDQPLELLVLSACETAAGDERAALGLAGVAIRSGARSALGSLWSIQDEAASRLIAQFYAQLREPGVSRAEALRRAQLALLDQERFRDPASWSGFLLINSWL